jgi:LEA14-like dessication related protein
MRIMRIILIGIGVALLAGILYLFVLYLDSDEETTEQLSPQLELAHMQVTNLSAERADMDMNVIIENPTPVDFNIDSLYYTVMIEGHEVARTTYPDPIHIEADQNTRVSFPFTVYYSRLQSLLDQLEEEGRDTVLYTIDATLFTDAVLLPDDQFDLKLEERLPLLRIPELRVTNLNIEDLDFSGAVIQVETYVVNENVFAVGFENMDYSLQVGDNQAIEGHKPEPLRIGAKDTALIRMPVEVNFGEMGRGLLDYIREGGDLPYFFSLNAKLVSDAEMLEESELAMTATGRLEELGEVAEEHVIEE